MLKRLLFWLFVLFCIAYPISVIGVAFDVRPPFSMAWAGSVLLILEGTLLIVAFMDMLALAGLIGCVIVGLLAYGVEALGVGTGFPFGVYHYTDVLQPHLPGSVPLPVIFAWLLIVLSVSGMLAHPLARIYGWLTPIVASCMIMLLDFELEPVATHIEHYWVWGNPGPVNYYGVPWTNFVAWLVIAFLLLNVVQFLTRPMPMLADFSTFYTRLPLNMGRILYYTTVWMFALVDLTHGYYWGVACAVLAALLGLFMKPMSYKDIPTIPVEALEMEAPFRSRRKHSKKGKKRGKSR